MTKRTTGAGRGAGMRDGGGDHLFSPILILFSGEMPRWIQKKYGSLGIAGIRERYGGILVVESPKYPHISSLPRRFPKTHK
jgi:hypothetical protein